MKTETVSLWCPVEQKMAPHRVTIPICGRPLCISCAEQSLADIAIRESSALRKAQSAARAAASH